MCLGIQGGCCFVVWVTVDVAVVVVFCFFVCLSLVIILCIFGIEGRVPIIGIFFIRWDLIRVENFHGHCLLSPLPSLARSSLSWKIFFTGDTTFTFLLDWAGVVSFNSARQSTVQFGETRALNFHHWFEWIQGKIQRTSQKSNVAILLNFLHQNKKRKGESNNQCL